MELRPVTPLDTVDGPHTALSRERAVIRRMPIARRHHERRLAGQPVHYLHDGVAVANRERSTGTEIVLHVDHDQRPHDTRI